MPKVLDSDVWAALLDAHFSVVQRCNRWGRFERWRIKSRGGDGAPGDVASWWGPIVLDGNVEQLGVDSLRDQCPVNLEEAVHTRTCIDMLRSHLKEAIWQEHVRAGRTQWDKADTLGVSRRTFRRRLAVAYPLLRTFMDAEVAA